MGMGNLAVRTDDREHTPLSIAKWMLRGRRRIADYFPSGLFGDPARDILLDLFVAAEDGRQIPVSSCCIASAVPATTALRYIEALKRHGLIESRPDPRDGRRMFVMLTPDAQEAMRAYLTAVARSRP